MQHFNLPKPLSGIRIVEFEAIGPGPLAGKILCDMGAEVTLISRPKAIGLTEQLLGPGSNPLHSGKTAIALDLKGSERDRKQALDHVARSDALIEGLRPGVMERLGLGPDVCAKINPRLVYGRMTGWGQDGPLAQSAGHDLNYVALSGLLSLSVRPGHPPVVPPAVVGDASGALGLAFGMVCALLDVRRGATGRVIDAAIVDIAAMLGTLVQHYHWTGGPGAGKFSVFSEAPFYDVYECADGKFVAIAALEPQFYALLLNRLGLEDVEISAQYDSVQWPLLKKRFAEVFGGKTRDEWAVLLEGTDACFAPVLDLAEASQHPHNLARCNFEEHVGGVILGRNAPRSWPLSDQVRATDQETER